MTPDITPEGPANHGPVFDCSWAPEGRAAATVLVSGTVDAVAARQFAAVLGEAIAHARLVVLDVRGVPSLGAQGVGVVWAASAQSIRAGGRLLVVGASAWLRGELAGARAVGDLEVLDANPLRLGVTHEPEPTMHPLHNPVNASVLNARVMAIAAQGLWYQDGDSAVGRAWAPRSEEYPAPPGARVEVYLTNGGEVNGWWVPGTDLAVNQRHLDHFAPPQEASPAACQGPCGLVWQAPAAPELLAFEERCLTCAGPLAFH